MAELMRAADIEREFGINPSTLATWRAGRVGPASFRLGRCVVYRRTAVLTWLATQERETAP